MRKVTVIEGRAIPLGLKNIDTDTIIAAQWLKTVTRDGLGKGAFEALRQSPDNLFDQPEYAGSKILIAGENFGCGSSREHAAWAMLDLGLRAVIAPSFSDIFASNAFKNGILTVELPQDKVDQLLAFAQDGELIIDLAAQTVQTSAGQIYNFEIQPFRKRRLLEGTDEIALTLASHDAISEFERRSTLARFEHDI